MLTDDSVFVNNHRHDCLLSEISYSSFEKRTSTSTICHQVNFENQSHINTNDFYDQTSTDQTMLVCQQSSSNENQQRTTEITNQLFLTSVQLSAYLISTRKHSNDNLLIIDCGSPLRHNEKRIKDSLLLNINDKISRKRLVNRGLKNFLDTNQLNRIIQSDFIVLYDDTMQSTTCSNSIQQQQQQQISSVIQCIFEQIKLFDSTKTIAILQSSFEEFYQHYPTLCYVSSSNLSIENGQISTPTPSLDIDMYQMSEILPGLYLGNARDAEDLNLLTENQIQVILNISTTIPCFYRDENLFDYVQLNCLDSTRENLLQYFPKILELIHEKLSTNKNILVHCQGGISRSPTFIIAYLMQYHSKTFDQAYELVKHKRKIINPNLNFLAQLTRFEQMCQAK